MMSLQQQKLENSKMYSILLVDDEKNILTSLKRLFRPLGYNIFVSSSGEEGLVILGKTKIDLVISDMNMPVMNGVRFLEVVAKNWPDTMRILLTGYADLDSTIDAINRGNIYRYVKKPWEDTDLVLVVEHALQMKMLREEHQVLLALSQQQNKELNRLNSGLEEEVNKRTIELNGALKEVNEANKKLKLNYVSLIKVFANVIGIRVANSKGCNRQIAEISQKIAVQMDLPHELTQNVLIAGLLHGIGKMGLSDELLYKSFSEQSAVERTEFNKYPLYGEKLLANLDSMHEVANIIRHQLERFDGFGTPDKLRGEKIPIGSRILAVTVGFERLRQDVIGKSVSPLEYMIQQMEKEKGRKYDPTIVDEFLRIVRLNPK
ncbi:MAG: response regulator, partial [Nitrosopumilus sp.]|nr:response regulator [Nitrosopumilus sp.]